MKDVVVILLIVFVLVFACAIATADHSRHKITFWSGGIAVMVYHSDGVHDVRCDGNHCRFTDRTGKTVDLTGDIQVEQE